MSEATNNNFDGYMQSFTLLYPDGLQAFNVSMGDLAVFNSQNIAMGQLYGASMGLSALMLVTLVLLTQPGKRRQPIFVLNVLALLFDLLRGTMLAVYTGSEWNNPYAYFSNDMSRITTQDVANSISVPVFKLIELIIIETSLLLQVRVVLATASRTQRFWTLLLSGTIGLIAISTQFAVTVVNAHNIALMVSGSGLDQQMKLASSASVTRTASVCVFMLIFTSKLFLALRQRVKFGIKRFGPMQVIFIGGLQTMIVPAIFAIADHYSDSDLASMSMTVLAIQLPLSALWASTSLEQRMEGGQVQMQPQRLIAGASERKGRSAKLPKHISLGTSKSNDSSVAPLSPGTNKDDAERMYDFNDMLAMGPR